MARGWAHACAVVLAGCVLALAQGQSRAADAAQPSSAHIHHAPAQARLRVSPLELSAADVAAGAAAFQATCASCHGANGKGGTPVAPGLPPAADLTSPMLRTHADGELFWVIGKGIPASGMPGFEASLDERKRWQLVAFLRTLGGVRLALAPPGAASDWVWQLPNGFPRPKVPADNPMSAAKVALGRHLFHDTRLSVDGTFSCATCHEQQRAFTDGRARSVGVTGEVHPRGAMSLANIAYSPVLTWANPTLRRLETQVLVPMFGDDPVEMGLSGREQALFRRLRGVRTYRRLFAAAFPGDADPINLANVTRAIAAFERTLLSGDSAYDRYRLAADPQAVPESTFPAAARRGEALFFSERTECFHCHGGFNFTETADYVGKGFLEIEFHNTGLYNIDGAGAYPAPNTGTMAVTDDPEHMGRFKAPTLRNVAVTAPYMHDGSIATLAEVIEHYASGGRTILEGPHRGAGVESPLKSAFVRPIDLTPEEKRDLVAFLESLTDTAFLTDPRFANPWD